MKTIFTLLVLSIIYLNCSAQTLISETSDMCDLLTTSFENTGANTVCLWVENPNIENGRLLPTAVDLLCPINIGQDQVLVIPNNVRIRLSDDGVFNLSGNGEIRGEQINGTRIMNFNSGPAINMDDCNGCSISTLTIDGNDSSNNAPDNKLGIDISENTTNAEVDTIKIETVQNGIVVAGSGNTFTDLQFENVGTNEDQCDPTGGNLNFAIQLNGSNNNSLTNVLHTMSPGAITLWLHGNCDSNAAFNLTVEQEGSECGGDGGDPSLYVDNVESTQNMLITNFNGGQIILDNNAICSDINNQNTIVPRTNCNNFVGNLCGN